MLVPYPFLPLSHKTLLIAYQQPTLLGEKASYAIYRHKCTQRRNIVIVNGQLEKNKRKPRPFMDGDEDVTLCDNKNNIWGINGNLSFFPVLIPNQHRPIFSKSYQGKLRFNNKLPA
jgi:hypothetical protein